MTDHLLSLIIWLPIISGIMIAFIKSNNFAKYIALAISIITTILSIILYIKFDSNIADIQFLEYYKWIPSLNINYHLGVDGISLPFIALNNIITLTVVIASLNTIKDKIPLYYSMFLLMTGFISGTFAAMDAMLFYVFFEAMLIPMYLIIGIWGGKNRVYAAIKFFLYTLLGSLLLLIAFIYLYHMSNNSFDIITFYHTKLTLLAQILIFIAFFFAFGVKVPMWPLHTWLPDAHPEAPTGGSMVLAAITLKIGGYGFIRFALPITPDASHLFATPMIILALIAIVYIGLVALVQFDMKKLVAYSSISHMGFVTLGIFMFTNNNNNYQLNPYGLEGSMIQMLSHGFISAAMFMIIGIMYERIHSRNISDYGGVATKMPIFASFFMLFVMSNCGLPATSGFVGEFMVIMGAMQVNIIYAILASLTLIIGAGYSLWLYKRTIFGIVTNDAINQLKDINCYELIVLLILASLVLIMGLYPNLFITKMHLAIEDIIYYAVQTKLP